MVDSDKCLEKRIKFTLILFLFFWIQLIVFENFNLAILNT